MVVAVVVIDRIERGRRAFVSVDRIGLEKARTMARRAAMIRRAAMMRRAAMTRRATTTAIRRKNKNEMTL